MPLFLRGDASGVVAALVPAAVSEGWNAASAGCAPGVPLQGMCAAALLCCQPFSSTLAGFSSARSLASLRFLCPGGLCSGLRPALCRFPVPCTIVNVHACTCGPPSAMKIVQLVAQRTVEQFHSRNQQSSLRPLYTAAGRCMPWAYELSVGGSGIQIMLRAPRRSGATADGKMPYRGHS